MGKKQASTCRIIVAALRAARQRRRVAKWERDKFEIEQLSPGRARGLYGSRVPSKGLTGDLKSKAQAPKLTFQKQVSETLKSLLLELSSFGSLLGRAGRTPKYIREMRWLQNGLPLMPRQTFQGMAAALLQSCGTGAMELRNLRWDLPQGPGAATETPSQSGLAASCRSLRQIRQRRSAPTNDLARCAGSKSLTSPCPKCYKD
jgi:hypothetical protein